MKSIFALFFFLCLLGTHMVAQPISKSSYEKTLEAARIAFSERNYYKSLEKYEEAYEERSDKTLIDTVAWLNLQLRDYSRAERWFGRLIDKDKTGEFNEYKYIYGRVMKMTENYAEAVPVLQSFVETTQSDSLRTLAKNEIIGAELAMELGPNTKGIVLENAGKKINTKLSEYSPSLSPDGGEVYFSTFEGDDVIFVTEEAGEEIYAKIFKAGKDDDSWESPEALGGEINRQGFHNSNVTLSADGSTLFFTRAQLQGNVLSESKIYYSTGGGSWKGAQELKGVNGDYLAKHPAPGELFGKEVLLFAANMPGGYGGFDLYYSTKTGEGTYSDPINLGKVINTAGDEETPHYRDGTLYFSSTGHPGMGGFDIFYTTWDGTTWSDPLNMGRPYNTATDDQGLTMDSEGYYGMLVSNRPGGRSAHAKTCCDDMYYFTIPKLFADLTVGLFTDGNKAPLLGGTVYLIPFQNEKMGDPNAQTSPEGNGFGFDLGLETPYMVIGTHPDYYPDTMQFNTVGLKESKSFKHFFYLKAKPVPPEYDTLVSETPIVLENILYDFDDDRIKLESEQDLEVVFELMTEYPDMVIELGSHTDNRGNDEYNENLSQRRAESARRWLTRKEIVRERIEAKGYGEKVPQTVSEKMAQQHTFLQVGDVLTPEFIEALATEEQKETAHSINRRTEFKIIAGPKSIVIKTTRLKKKEEVKKGSNRNSQASPTHSPAAADAVKAPKMQFKQRLVDFGKVKRGEKRSHTFEFTNIGNADLHISLVSSCDCTTIVDDPSGRTYKPGQSGKIGIVFDSTEKEESETVDVDIFTDDTAENGKPLIEMVQYKFELY